MLLSRHLLENKLTYLPNLKLLQLHVQTTHQNVLLLFALMPIGKRGELTTLTPPNCLIQRSRKSKPMPRILPSCYSLKLLHWAWPWTALTKPQRLMLTITEMPPRATLRFSERWLKLEHPSWMLLARSKLRSRMRVKLLICSTSSPKRICGKTLEHSQHQKPNLSLENAMRFKTSGAKDGWLNLGLAYLLITRRLILKWLEINTSRILLWNIEWGSTSS